MNLNNPEDESYYIYWCDSSTPVEVSLTIENISKMMMTGKLCYSGKCTGSEVTKIFGIEGLNAPQLVSTKYAGLNLIIGQKMLYGLQDEVEKLRQSVIDTVKGQRFYLGVSSAMWSDYDDFFELDSKEIEYIVEIDRLIDSPNLGQLWMQVKIVDVISGSSEIGDVLVLSDRIEQTRLTTTISTIVSKNPQISGWLGFGDYSTYFCPESEYIRSKSRLKQSKFTVISDMPMDELVSLVESKGFRICAFDN